MTRDGQGWPVVNGRRLPEVYVRAGFHLDRIAWGVSVSGGVTPNVPSGFSFYRWTRGIYVAFGYRSISISWS